MGPPGEGPAAKRARTGAKGKGKAAAAAAGVRSEEDAAALSACTSAVRALPSAARLAACATPQALAALKKALEAALTKARQAGAEADRRRQLANLEAAGPAGLMEPSGGPLSTLPNEVVVSILSQVDTPELVRLSAVNRAWRKMLARPEPFRVFSFGYSRYLCGGRSVKSATDLCIVLSQMRFRMLEEVRPPSKVVPGRELFKLLHSRMPNLQWLDLSACKGMTSHNLKALGEAKFIQLRHVGIGEPKMSAARDLGSACVKVITANKDSLVSFMYTGSFMSAVTQEMLNALVDVPNLKHVRISDGTYDRSEGDWAPSRRAADAVTSADILRLILTKRGLTLWLLDMPLRTVALDAIQTRLTAAGADLMPERGLRTSNEAFVKRVKQCEASPPPPMSACLLHITTSKSRTLFGDVPDLDTVVSAAPPAATSVTWQVRWGA